MICEHGLLKRSCETCWLQLENKELKEALKRIVSTSGNIMFRKFSEDGHKRVVAIAEKTLDEI